MSKYERCREDVISHTEQGRMPGDMRRCPGCNGTGEGKMILLGLGRGKKEEHCRLCKGSGRAKDTSHEILKKAPIDEVRKHVDRFK